MGKKVLIFLIIVLAVVGVVWGLSSRGVSESPALGGVGQEELTGTLGVLIVDDFDMGSSDVFYRLQNEDTSVGNLNLIFSGKGPGGISGQEIVVWGNYVGDDFYVSNYELIGEDILKNPNLNIGAQKIVVLLGNYQDNPIEPISVEEVRERIFDEGYALSANSYHREASYNKTWLTGDVFGWYTLPCNEGGGCDFDKELIKAADPDVYFPSYFRLILVSSANSPGGGTVGRILIDTDDGRVLMSQINLDTNHLEAGSDITAHELGHNFGVYHADDYECAEEVVGDDCESKWYGDTFSIMGCIPYRDYCGHFDASFKEVIGWFSQDNVLEVSENGTYRINVYELPSDGVQVLKIPAEYEFEPCTYCDRSKSSHIYVYYRQPIGFDNNSQNLDGVMMTLNAVDLDDGRFWDSQLLDLSPHNNTEVSQRIDSGDVVLREGEIYVNDDYGFSIEVLEENGDYAGVKVEFG